MGVSTTPTRAPSRIKSLKGNFPFLYGEDFSRFFPESFPGVITAAAAITTIITITTTKITITLIIIIITTITINGTPTRVKALSFGETF